jgi:hypothetical protein
VATFYRSMRADEDGRPKVARARWGLGVRVDGEKQDIQVTNPVCDEDDKLVDGEVGPLGGGLSMSLDWRTIEPSMLPRAFGGSAPKSYVLYEIDEEIITKASLRARKAEPRLGIMSLSLGVRCR